MDYNKILEENSELTKTVFADDVEKKLRPILEEIGMIGIKIVRMKVHSNSNKKQQYIETMENLVSHYISLIPMIVENSFIPEPIVIHNKNSD